MRRIRSRWRLVPLVCLAIGCLAGSGLRGAESAPRAGLEITGLGWWGNRTLRATVERLLGEERGEVFGANAIENAVVLILSSLEDRGYLHPVITVAVTAPDGTESRYSFDETLADLLPRSVEGRAVRFEVDRGVRYEVDEVTIVGLDAIPLEDGVAFFRPEGVLLPGLADRPYTPGRVRRAADRLQAELERRGLAQASVTAGPAAVDDETGAVDLAVEVDQGPPWRVSGVEIVGTPAPSVDLGDPGARVGQAWSSLWQQDLAEDLRQRHFRAGYPDVQVRVRARRTEPAPDGSVAVGAEAEVAAGPHVSVGSIRFEGAERTRESVLLRRATLSPGDPLDPLALERMRFRLAQLGIFERIDLEFAPPTGGVRDAVFSVEEVPPWDASILAGYGSYERLRAGVEFRQYNVFGRAHQTRLSLVQSMKSTRANYSYTVPELFGESIDVSARLFGLQREERAFLRQEYGGGISARREFGFFGGVDVSAGLVYQALRSKENELTTRTSDDEQVTVASVELGLSRDTRDNPLLPRRGYRWYTQLEAASQALGGQVDYQRFELGMSAHWPWRTQRWVHAGLSHGVITTLGADGDPPVNKRFFPGGDGSIRGFAGGEASPRAADGRFVGAKSFVLLNVEIEQTLFGNFSAVIFADALGVAARLADYPFDDDLYSVGVGLRYRSLVGPLRLEYGRNLNPRSGDPDGTLHFSVGFPF